MTTGRVLQLLGPSTGGIRRHVTYLAERLRASGWTVDLAGPEGVVDDLTHVVPIPKRDRPAAARRARRALAPLLAQYDLVHAHGLKPALLTASFRSAPPMVLSVHNLVLDEVAGRSAPALRWLEGRLPARAAATIAISDGVAARFRGLPGAERIVVIPPAGPPPTPSRDAATVRAELGIAPDDDLVITPARLTPQKDIPLLLDAASLVRQRRPQLRWFVFGDGWLRDELEAAVVQRGLVDTVRLEPGRPDVDSELAAADLVAVTSRWESGPLVLLEAAALGRPTVSTDVGLARTVVGATGGRVVPVGDPGALADAVIDTLERAESGADAAAGPSPALDALTPPALADAVEHVYREVLGHGS